MGRVAVEEGADEVVAMAREREGSVVLEHLRAEHLHRVIPRAHHHEPEPRLRSTGSECECAPLFYAYAGVDRGREDLESGDQSIEVTSSVWPAYVRCSMKGANSFSRPGAFQICTCVPWLAATYLRTPCQHPPITRSSPNVVRRETTGRQTSVVLAIGAELDRLHFGLEIEVRQNDLPRQVRQNRSAICGQTLVYDKFASSQYREWATAAEQ